MNKKEMFEELKPCPFCNGEAKLSCNYMIIKSKSQKCAWVYCQKCGAKTKYQIKSTVEHYMKCAIDNWNRRTDNENDK